MVDEEEPDITNSRAKKKVKEKMFSGARSDDRQESMIEFKPEQPVPEPDSYRADTPEPELRILESPTPEQKELEGLVHSPDTEEQPADLPADLPVPIPPTGPEVNEAAAPASSTDTNLLLGESEESASQRISDLTKALSKSMGPPARSRSRGVTSAAVFDPEKAFNAFAAYEDSVERAAAVVEEHNKPWAMGPIQLGWGAPDPKGEVASVCTMITTEEVSRKAHFDGVMACAAGAAKGVAAVGSRDTALRTYARACESMLNKLTRRLPKMPAEIAPLASAYLSAVSQHHHLARTALPAGVLR